MIGSPLVATLKEKIAGENSSVCLRDSERFSELLQETEHFRRWGQEKVAKIVPYGPPQYDEGRWINSGGLFSLPAALVTGKDIKWIGELINSWWQQTINSKT